MPLVIQDPKLDQKIQKVAHALGKSVEETIWLALERMDVAAVGERQLSAGKQIDWPEIRRILAEVDALPILDHRTADEILGYNEHGHFD